MRVSSRERLAIAWMIAMTQFHSTEHGRAGRKPATMSESLSFRLRNIRCQKDMFTTAQPRSVASDANSHLYLTRAMGTFTISIVTAGRRDGWPRSSHQCCWSAFAATGCTSAEDVRSLYRDVQSAEKEVEYRELDSPNGHDAFPQGLGHDARSRHPISGAVRDLAERALEAHG
ncbi:MAG: hypothetical protein R2839_00535 [Thermomicrobiales bacterium]